jgi:hypothetical protein
MAVGIANLEHAGMAKLNLGGLQSAMSEAFELATGGGGHYIRVGVNMDNVEIMAGRIVIPDCQGRQNTTTLRACSHVVKLTHQEFHLASQLVNVAVQ